MYKLPIDTVQLRVYYTISDELPERVRPLRRDREDTMTKNTNRPTASVVTKQLKRQGVTAKRVTNKQGERVWQTSDGKEFVTLRDVATAYKLEG